MTTPDEDIAMLTTAATALGEHFDSVQIFATRHEPTEADGTITCSVGVGNWYARYGQVHEWIIEQDEYTRVSARGPEEEE